MLGLKAEKLFGGLINAFLSVLGALQVETARNLYLCMLWYECWNEFNFRNVLGIMNTLGLLQSKLT